MTLTLFVNGSADDEREFDYGERSKKGPARWGELHREWSLCKNGSMQSPIDLLDERVEFRETSEELQSLQCHSYQQGP